MDKKTPMLRIVLAVIALLAALAWLVLPVLSFTFVIPLFSLNGYGLVFYFNQMMMPALLVVVMMIVAALIGDRRMILAVGLADIAMCVAVMLLKKEIVTGGDLKWLYTSASLLIEQIGKLAGVTVTESTLNSYVELACDNFLKPGAGLWIHMILGLVYVIVERRVGNESGDAGRRSGSSRGTSYGTKTSGSSGTTYGTKTGGAGSGSKSFSHHT